MDYICSNCIGEEYLKKYIRKNGIKNYCSYCSMKKEVIEFEKIIDIINDGLLYLYDDPVNGLGWENGEYIEGTSPIRNSYDLLGEYFDVDEKVFQNLNSFFSDNLWCKKDFYGLDDSEESFFTWKNFKDITKHKFRFFFNFNSFSESEYSKYKKPNDILKEIMKISSRLGLFTILKKGTVLFRARSGYHLSLNELCSPAPQESLYSNRFSPAGISMFYGSGDETTCLREINKTTNCSIGQWELLQDMLIFDLTYKFQFDNGIYCFRNFPSIFDAERRRYYHDYTFILDFASDISKIVIKKKDENIDYVPTQIVTEYLKLHKNKLMGIRYYSTKNGQKNYCLFIDKKDCERGKILKMINSFYVK
jgi:hypothetical protein